MKENLSLLKKIALKAGFSWFLVVGIGVFTSLVCLITSFFLYQNYEGVSGFEVITNALRHEFWTLLLFVSSIAMLLFSVLYANKYAIHTTLSLVWKEKMQAFIAPKLETYIANISKKQPNWLSSVTNASALKMKLLGEMRFDSNINSINKKVLQYGFKKINMDDVDFSQPNLDYPAIIAYKINEKITEMAKPSLKLFWGLLILLFVIMIIAIVKMPR
ncbi:hypothetical protein [Flavobacterium sp.]|uniref:hypothetical protein n=1 Tax=Flavobacterium sp. TaxID=239 RepID=UPI00286E4682|nr:hypothetical protein [Flavobacterium sp.]